MNKRTEELLIKSGFATGYDRHQHGHWRLSDSEAEKFAVLIARECASIYDKIDNGNEHQGTKDYLEALARHFDIKR